MVTKGWGIMWDRGDKWGEFIMSLRKGDLCLSRSHFHQGLKDEAVFFSKGWRAVDAVVRGQFKGLVRGTRNISPDPSALR